MAPVDIPEIKGSLISYFSNLIKKFGGINLAQGIPGFNPPSELINSLERTIKIGNHQYAPGIGNLKLVSYLENFYATSINNNKVLVTNGATEAISLIYNYLMSINQIDEFNVAAFSPAYESYIHLPKIFRHKFFTFSTDDEKYFDEKEFENFFVSNRIKLLFVASPGNPYGKVMPADKLDFLIKLAEKRNAFIILDSVYNDLYFGELKPNITNTALNSRNLFYVNSFSKKFSITGWRIGYMIMHESHFEKMSYTHDYIGLCAPAPLQAALADFVGTQEADKYVNDTRILISKNYFDAVNTLSENNFYCPKCDGGYFVWCRLPDRFNDSLKFGLELYDKTKTAIIPGVHFGEEWRKFIRINVARPTEELQQGLLNIVRQ
jgi:aspartate/methionine/tyrosine aminotransferase